MKNRLRCLCEYKNDFLGKYCYYYFVDKVPKKMTSIEFMHYLYDRQLKCDLIRTEELKKRHTLTQVVNVVDKKGERNFKVITLLKEEN